MCASYAIIIVSDVNYYAPKISFHIYISYFHTEFTAQHDYGRQIKQVRNSFYEKVFPNTFYLLQRGKVLYGWIENIKMIHKHGR